MTSDRPLSAALGTSFAEVIGDPIAQSKSPLIHGYWLEKLGIAADYRRAQVTRAELPSFIAERRADPHWRGCNVTMPLKLDALLLATESRDEAVQVGACNTLMPDPTGLTAANTDVGAIVLVLKRLAEQRPTHSVTLLGTGGAARAVLVALKSLGFTNVAIHARDAEQAFHLANSFGLKQRPQPFDAPIATDGLINATPLGMTGAPPFTLDLGGLPPGGWVFDLVTSPDPTALVTAAQARGLAATGGLTMLVEQAAAAFPLFFGAPPPRSAEDDAELYRRLRA
ncbi:MULTISPECIES: shikimate dehydrogenase family protein [Sphingomonas]|uniref:shikimate dehydrogenase family protein n=1 Tax=Sphingomonas TaxID=13687 RepID=UPI000DEF45D4|nr:MULTISPECIES: shikimate dehydrogenase [Sphingomonas]